MSIVDNPGQASINEHLSEPAEDNWQEFVDKLGSVMSWIGVNGYKAQVLAAEHVADILRNYLAEGGYGELAPLRDATIQSIGGKFRQPLAGLARHIIVLKRPSKLPKQAHGAGGRFTSGFHPTQITFEKVGNKDYGQIAFDLNYGKIWIPTPNQKRYLQARIIESGGAPPERKEQGIVGVQEPWMMEPRPFLHILTGPEAHAQVAKVVEGVFSGKITKRDMRWKNAHIPSDEEPAKTVNYDDVQDWLNVGTASEYGIEDILDAKRSGIGEDEIDDYFGGGGGGSSGGWDF